MEIYINKEKMSFELENEKNSLDIVNAVVDYTVNSSPQHFITKILIDNKEFFITDEEKLKKVKIDKIDRIYFETQDLYEVTNLTINQIESFLKLLAEVLKNQEEDVSIEKIQDSIAWMKNGISQIIKIFAPKENYLKDQEAVLNENCGKIIESISKLENKKNKEEINKSLNYIELIGKSIKNIRNWLINSYILPDNEIIFNDIEKLIDKITDLMPKLENVPILFQTGDDKETMNIIQHLTDILEKSINLFILFKESLKIHMDKYTVKEVSFEEFFKTITSHLKQLMEAIKNNDSVIVGDLLEYEFVPNLEEIKNILIKIKDEAFDKIN